MIKAWPEMDKIPAMITKAIIPIAGKATRLRPLTDSMAKAMISLPAGNNTLLPVVHLICAEAAAAGIQEVLLVVSPDHQQQIERYFKKPRSGQPALPECIEIAVQLEPLGFGNAVAMGQDFAAGEPFMLFLGDHVYRASSAARPCAAQVADAFAMHDGVAMIGVQEVAADELDKVGAVAGVTIGQDVFRCVDFIEKPTAVQANDRLAMPELDAGRFLAHCGIYIFGPEIFGCLGRLDGDKGPVELAAAQSMLLKKNPDRYNLCRISGRAYDVGTPENYAKTFAAMAGFEF